MFSIIFIIEEECLIPPKVISWAMYSIVITAAFDEKRANADHGIIQEEGFKTPTAAHHQGAVKVFAFTSVRHSCPSSSHVTIQAITPNGL